MPRTASVIATDICTISELPKKVLIALEDCHPSMFEDLKLKMKRKYYNTDSFRFKKYSLKNITLFNNLSEDTLFEIIALMRS